MQKRRRQRRQEEKKLENRKQKITTIWEYPKNDFLIGGIL